MSSRTLNTIVGVDIDDLHTDVKVAVRAARELQFQMIEAGAVTGDLTPRSLSESGRRHFRRFVEGSGLRLGALTADMPNLRLTDEKAIEQRVERTCEILTLARDLGISVVSAGVGALTHPETSEPSPTAIDGLRRIGEFADRRGVRFALRPGHDAGERIVRVLTALACPSIGVCLDPAALVMSGANPLASIERYLRQLALVHARDATAGLAARGEDEVHAGHETSLGAGDVDLSGLLHSLREGDYHEPIILRRKESLNPMSDLSTDRTALLDLMSQGIE